MLGATGNLFNDAVGLAAEVIPAIVNDVSIAGKHHSHEKSMNEYYLKKADRRGKPVSELLKDDIFLMADNNDLVEISLLSKAIKTNKWINYAIYYMTHDTNLIKCDEHTRKFLNGIGELAGFGKLYHSCESTDIRRYDSRNKERRRDSRFILLLDELKARLQDEKFQTDMRLRMAKMKHNINPAILFVQPKTQQEKEMVELTRYKEGLTHPLLFDIYKPSSNFDKKGYGIDNPTFERLEKAFSKLITDKYYSYAKDDHGMIQLTLIKNNTFGAKNIYTVDTGLLMGGSTISIMGIYKTVKGTTDKIFVDVAKYPDIAYNILTSVFYLMTPAEVNRVMAGLIGKGIVYKYIDFSNTTFFDYLDEASKIELGDRLISAIHIIDKRDPNLTYIPRFRFDSFIDIRNFTLISDNRVFSPFASTGETSSFILEGLSIRFQDGQMYEYFGGNLIEPVLDPLYHRDLIWD